MTSESPGTRPDGRATVGFTSSQSGARTLAEIGLVLVALALVVLGLRSCTGWVADLVVAHLPASADETIGKAAAESMRARHGIAGAKPAPEQIARSERIFGELRAALTPEEVEVLRNPRITVVVDQQVNAFALPGGEVFVLTGLLDRADDDMLRGVLGHEIGHAVRRHGVRSIVRNAAYGIALAMLLGGSDDVVAQIVAGASQLDSLHYSRSMEEEADAFGVDLLRRTGHDAEGLARFLESLETMPVPELLSTHPDSKERAKKIRAEMKK